MRLNFKVFILSGEKAYEDSTPKEIAQHPDAEILEQPLEEWSSNYPDGTLNLIAAGVAAIGCFNTEDYHIAWHHPMSNRWGRVKP